MKEAIYVYSIEAFGILYLTVTCPTSRFFSYELVALFKYILDNYCLNYLLRVFLVYNYKWKQVPHRFHNVQQ